MTERMTVKDRAHHIIRAVENDKVRLFNEQLGRMSSTDMGNVSDNIIDKIEQTLSEVEEQRPRDMLAEFGNNKAKQPRPRKLPASPGKQSETQSFFDVAERKKGPRLSTLGKKATTPQNTGFAEWTKGKAKPAAKPKATPSPATATPETAKSETSIFNQPRITGRRPLRNGHSKDVSDELRHKFTLPTVAQDDKNGVEAKPAPATPIQPSDAAEHIDLKEAAVQSLDREQEGPQETPETVGVQEEAKAPRGYLKRLAGASPALLGVTGGLAALEMVAPHHSTAVVLGAWILAMMNAAIAAGFFKINIWKQTFFAAGLLSALSLFWLSPVSIVPGESFTDNPGNLEYSAIALAAAVFILTGSAIGRKPKAKRSA